MRPATIPGTPLHAAFALLLLSTFLSGSARAGVLDQNGQCVGDVDGDGQVTADELVTSVNNALGSCDLTPVTLRFRAQVGDAPFVCGNTYDNVGTASSRWLPADLRFYVHGVRLIKSDHSEVRVRLTQDVCSPSNPARKCWQDDDTALLDFEDKTAPCNDGSPRSPTAPCWLSERFECFHCHGGFNFSASTTFVGKLSDEVQFDNNGLYNLDGMGAYPPGNRGILEISGKPQDMGRFKAPTLRNIELTAPYMHDGTIATLDEVLVDHYGRGGRLITEGPNAGDGSKNPFKSPFLSGFTMTDQEKQEIMDLLHSLTDERWRLPAARADRPGAALDRTRRRAVGGRRRR